MIEHCGTLIRHTERQRFRYFLDEVVFPLNFPTNSSRHFLAVCTRKRATTQDVLSVEACQNVTPRPKQGFRIVDTPYLVLVNSKKIQSSSFAPFMSFTKNRSTSVKVTSDLSFALPPFFSQLFFPFRTTFSRVFHLCLYFSPWSCRVINFL